MRYGPAILDCLANHGVIEPFGGGKNSDQLGFIMSSLDSKFVGNFAAFTSDKSRRVYIDLEHEIDGTFAPLVILPDTSSDMQTFQANLENAFAQFNFFASTLLAKYE